MDNLLTAKEAAARMVVDLYASSLSAPILFDDTQSVKAATERLGRNPEVAYAYVFPASSVPGSQPGETVGGAAPLSELVRQEQEGGNPSAPTVARGVIVERRPSFVEIVQSIQDPEGQIVGMTRVGFSLARENASIVATKRRVMALSGGLAALVAAVLVILTRIHIVQPLQLLARAARKLERGEPAPVAIASNDELGTLGRAFTAMADAIAQREASISARNRDMRLVLDNVEQGLMTVDREGKIAPEYSAAVARWFGAPRPQQLLWEYLRPADSALGEWLELGWESLTEGYLPLSVLLDQLPKRVTQGGQTFGLSYRPILGETPDDWTQIIVVVTDITKELEAQRAEQAQKEMMAVFLWVLRDRSGFVAFFEEARRLVDAVIASDGSNAVELKRDVHTLKGNFGICGLSTIAACCHDLETRMIESPGPLTVEDRAKLTRLWHTVQDMAKSFISLGEGRLEVSVTDYASVVESLRSGADRTLILKAIGSWQNEPVVRSFERFVDRARDLGRRLGKGDVTVDIVPSDLRLPPRRWAPFWAALTHAVRNSVDHGLESPEERKAKGKSQAGKITLSAVVREDTILITIADDGRGIDWDKLRKKATAMGIAVDGQEALVEALFRDSVSTRDEASDVSGRGVGMGALRAAVESMGGSLTVDSFAGRGTAIRCSFPIRTATETGILSHRPLRAPSVLSGAPASAGS